MVDGSPRSGSGARCSVASGPGGGREQGEEGRGGGGGGRGRLNCKGSKGGAGGAPSLLLLLRWRRENGRVVLCRRHRRLRHRPPLRRSSSLVLSRSDRVTLLMPMLRCLFLLRLVAPSVYVVPVHLGRRRLLLSAHELEVVHLLQLGDDELAPHVGDLHLELVDLHVAQLDGVVDIVHLAFGRHPPVVVLLEDGLELVDAGLLDRLGIAEASLDLRRDFSHLWCLGRRLGRWLRSLPLLGRGRNQSPSVAGRS